MKTRTLATRTLATRTLAIRTLATRTLATRTMALGVPAIVALALCLPGPLLAVEQDALVEAPVSRFENVHLIEFGPPGLRDGGDETKRMWESHESLAGKLEDLLLPDVEALGGSLYASDDSLVVTGGAEAADLVRKRVAAIDTFVQGVVTLSVAAVHVHDPERARDVASIRQALAEGRAETIWSGRVTSRRGEAIVREATDDTTVIADFDVEVANSAAIADPLVATLVTGWRLTLLQRAIDSDHVMVNASFQYSDLARLDEVAVGTGTLHRPHVPFVAATVPLVVKKGEPQVVYVGHPAKDGVLALTVGVVKLPDVPRLPYRLVDTAAYAGVGTQPHTEGLGLDPWIELDDEKSYFADTQQLHENLVVMGVGTPLTGTLFAVTADRPQLGPRPMRRIVRRTWRDVVPTNLPGYDPLDGSIDQAAADALVSRPPSDRISLTTMWGARTSCLAGVWTRVLADYDVEIADTAAIMDPIVYAFVEGDMMEIDELGVAADGDITVSWAAVRSFNSEMKSLVVRRDILGNRVEEDGDRYDQVRHRSWAGRVVVGDDTPPDVRLTGRKAEIDLWSRD